MNRLFIATRGIGNWRERLANPDRQWKPKFSAFEAAVSWENAASTGSGIPAPIEKLLHQGGYHDLHLLFAVAEHKVKLLGGNADSQCDVWGAVKTSSGILSLSIEAKAKEKFGDDILEKWLRDGKDKKLADRNRRWEHIRKNLPVSDSFHLVRYQILHRCAAAVIEAKRMGFQHAAFVVQAFNTPDRSFRDYAMFCSALGIPASRGSLAGTSVGGIPLSIGWADCPLATFKEVAATV